jgi:hypothetical protein
MAVDAGVDAGSVTTQEPELPKQFISELVEATTGTVQTSEDKPVSAFQGMNVDAVAFDSARQFVVAEINGQVYGHYTQNRGGTFAMVPIDPSGLRPKVTYEPKSRTVFVCYNALGGVRVRVSNDYGKTFRSGALDLVDMPPVGTDPTPIMDCDIAPWQEGKALVTAVKGEEIRLWTVTSDATVDGDLAGVSVFAAGDPSQVGTYFSPGNPAIATLPSDYMVHILFEVQRKTSGGITDDEVIGLYRDSTTGGGFVGPLHVHQANSFSQKFPAVAIDPVTKRAVAAFVSKESSIGALPYDTVYVSYWKANWKVTDANRDWLYGPDLNVFAQNNVKQYIVVPQRPAAAQWIARQPSVAVTPSGKVLVAFAAGDDNNAHPLLTPWVVQWSFDAQSPLATAKGWFVPPAITLSDTHVVTANGSGSYTGPVLVPDSQISYYATFIEGVGPQSDVANRPMMVSRPK